MKKMIQLAAVAAGRLADAGGGGHRPHRRHPDPLTQRPSGSGPDPGGAPAPGAVQAGVGVLPGRDPDLSGIHAFPAGREGQGEGGPTKAA